MKRPRGGTTGGHMLRKTAATIALALAALAVFAGTAAAGVTCQTNAAAEIAGANVNGPRAGWDPPVWTFDMPDLNMSVDVQAYTRDDAASKAQAWLGGQVDSACAAQAPAPAQGGAQAAAPSGATSNVIAYTPQSTQAASDLLASAKITYLGNSWGPVPLWEVSLPTLNTTIDIAAVSADDARAALVNVVAGMLGGTTSVTSPAPTVTTPAVTAPTTSDPAAVATAVAASGLTIADIVGPGYGGNPAIVTG